MTSANLTLFIICVAQDPEDGEEVLKERYAKLGKELEDRFRALLD